MLVTYSPSSKDCTLAMVDEEEPLVSQGMSKSVTSTFNSKGRIDKIANGEVEMVSNKPLYLRKRFSNCGVKVVHKP